MPEIFKMQIDFKQSLVDISMIFLFTFIVGYLISDKTKNKG